MTIQLPKNEENWTNRHADRCLEHAHRLFQLYEAKVVDTWPAERINELYRPYQLARQQAVEVCRYVRWRAHEAEMLP